MPKFKNREEYERWKAEKMQNGDQTPLEMTSDIPGNKKKKTGIYISLAVSAIIALLVFIGYKQFSGGETWTDTSYTNWELAFTMDIPEGWDKYDFTLKERAMLKMENFASGGRGKILFALAPDNRRDTGYTMMYLDIEGINADRIEDRSSVLLNSLASEFSRGGYKVEQFEKAIAGINIPFVRAVNRGKNIFIMGNFLFSPEKTFFVQFIANSGEYEKEFWRSIESFEFIEE